MHGALLALRARSPPTVRSRSPSAGSSGSTSFTRVTFVGADLADFGRDGLDQRIKIVLPDAAGCAPRVEDFTGDWYQAWREQPEAERHPFRT